MIPATQRLVEDVEAFVLKGRTVPTAPRQYNIDEATKASFRSMGRYVDRNKRKLVLVGVGLTVAGVLTGGVAVGVAAAAQATSYGARRLYRRFQRWRNEKKVRALFSDLFDESSGRFRDIDFALGTDKGADARFGQVIDAVRILIAHRDFSAMVTEFTELMDAAQRFHDLNDRHRSGFTSCAEAIHVLQALNQFSYYFERLRHAITFFDNLVLFVVLEQSRMEDEFGQAVPKLIAHLKAKYPDTAMNVLNTAANSSGVLHTRWYESEKDYREWVRSALDPWARSLSEGPAGPLGGREASMAQTTVSSAKAAAPLSATGFAVGQGTDQGIRAAISAGGGQVGSLDLVGGMASGGTQVAVGIMTEVANAKWNSKLYHKAKVLRPTGWRDQTLTERVGIIKTVLKPSLERFVNKFDHWRTSHKEYLADPTSPERALRTRKHWAQSVGSEAYKMVCEFHQTVVGMANVEAEKIFGDANAAIRYQNFIESEGRFAHVTTGESPTVTCVEDDILNRVDSFLSHGHAQIGPCSGYCYIPIKHVGDKWPVPDLSRAPAAAGDMPLKAITDVPKEITL